MSKPGPHPGIPPRGARQPMFARFGTWTVVALLGIALVDAAFFIVHVDAAAAVDHSRTVSTIARDARSLAGDRRTAIGSFAITGNPTFAASDARARRDLAVALDSLASLTTDNPGQLRRARAIAHALARWDSAYAAPALAGKSGDPAVASAGPELFTLVAERFAEFEAAADVLYDERSRYDRTLAAIALLATLLPISVLAAITLAVRRRLQAQTAAILDQQAQLEDQAIELENQVEELELANRELTDAGIETERARQRAELALAERDRIGALLDAALESSTVGFAFLTPDLRYARVNPRLAAARNLLAEEFVGRTVPEMASTPAAGATALANLRHVIESGKPVLDADMVGMSPTGERQRYLINYFPIRNADATLVGVGMVVTDTTDRSRLEEQFRQSQKMEALGRLASGVAHDFRNLLTVVRSYCDLAMLETPETDPRRWELLEIRGAADRAAVLARQLLSFGRPQPLLAVELNVNEGVAGVEAMLRHIAPAGVAVETRLAADLGTVLVDPGHVEQVLMNLAINSIDAMPNGGRLTFETSNAALDAQYSRNHPGVLPGQYVMLSVTDTGIGMDEGTRARIFEPFFTTKPPGTGTGLGLATVYGIVTQNGGHTWVYSEPGQGTTFKIYFPRLAASGSREGMPRRDTPVPVHAKAAETVLLVEDDLAVRGSLKHILQRFGYRVLEAEHGADALHVARTHDGPIHLAISDLTMPVMSGREFAAQLHEARPATHVLFMSGFTDEHVVTSGLLGHDEAFIQKPFAIEEITRKVHEVLQAG